MKKILYSGSFDPITNGHLDIIQRASRLCDTLVVGIITNPSKKPMFTVAERKQMILAATEGLDMDNVEVDSFTGLLADYVREKNIGAVVRGLRGPSDFEAELQMAQINARLYDKFESIFMMTNPTYSFVSSSAIKEMFLLDGCIKGLVPEIVLKYMEAKVKLAERR